MSGATENFSGVIFGAGTAGIGVSDQLRNAMMREGLSKDEAAKRFWCVDREGLLTAGMDVKLGDHQMVYARTAGEGKSWRRDEDGAGVSLSEVVRHVNPTRRIGASGTAGAFTEEIVREMAAPVSGPSSLFCRLRGIASKPNRRI